MSEEQARALRQGLIEAIQVDPRFASISEVDGLYALHDRTQLAFLVLFTPTRIIFRRYRHPRIYLTCRPDPGGALNALDTLINETVR